MKIKEMEWNENMEFLFGLALTIFGLKFSNRWHCKNSIPLPIPVYSLGIVTMNSFGVLLEFIRLAN